MNVAELNAAVSAQGVYPDAGSGVSSLGNKGDIIEGVVRKVSDKVSIDFNSRELEFPRTAVQDAREGKTIKFQIMDVSDDRIVLKALESPGAAATELSAGIVGTQLETGVTVTDADNPSSGDIAENNYSNIDNMTGEDARAADHALDGSHTELEEYRAEAFDRLIEAVKSMNELKDAAIEGWQERAGEITKAIERASVKNRLPDGISGVLAEYFLKYDIPVTDEKLEQLGNACNQLSGIGNVDDRTIKYMLQSELTISISNLYNASFMGSSITVNQQADEEVFDELRPQVENIISSSGYTVSNESIARARWLFANNIPINKENLDRQNALLGLKENGPESLDIYDRMVSALAVGADPAEADLFDTPDAGIRQLVQDIRSLDAQNIELAVGTDRTINISTLKSIGTEYSTADEEQKKQYDNIIDTMSEDVRVITARRQLEEIRLRMTIDSARSLTARGIDIDTTRLSDIVEELKAIEREAIKDTLAAQGMQADEQETSIISTAMEYRRCIAGAPAYAAVMARQLDIRGEGNLTAYADMSVVETARAQRAENAYETMMTVPRSDLGDSIQKAFANVDSLISANGLEVNDVNRRIVRMLAHNNMAISSDNIQMMQDYDARMQYMLKGLTPETTFEMIKSGHNPLTMSLDELNTVINDINSSMGEERRDDGESSYSRFLWKLQKENRISEEERKSYIGICRLVRHVSKNDSAALGAVVNSGMELTLKNLMTAVRSRRDAGMDEYIDDSYTGRRRSGDAQTIDSQVASAFEYNAAMLTEDEIYDMISPTALYDAAGGDIDNLFNMPLDELASKLKEQSSGDGRIDREYYDNLAREISDGVKEHDVMEFIKAYDLEPSVFTITAVRQIMGSGQTVFSDMLGIAKEQDDNTHGSKAYEYEEAVEGLLDALTDDESMRKQNEKAAAAAKSLLESGERGVLKDEDLYRLRTLNSGIRLNRLLSDRRTYEIPIATDSGITNINLTLVSGGTSEKGMVNIRMNSEKYGNMMVEYRIQGNRLQGLILTQSRAEGIEDLYNDVSEAAKECGYEVVSINRAVHNVTGSFTPDSVIQRDTGGMTADTSGLYRLSKNIIHKISSRL